MVKQIIVIQAVLLIFAFFCSCGDGRFVGHYHCEDNGFSFTMVEEEDSSFLIIGNTDTIVYSCSLNGDYGGIEFLLPDSTESIYMLDIFHEIKRVVSFSFQIEIVNLDTFRKLSKKFASSCGCSEYHGGYERDGRYTFTYCHNGKYRYLLKRDRPNEHNDDED